MFINAPPMPPNNMPIQITVTESGKIPGQGPDMSIHIKKKIVPAATNLGNI